MTPSPHTLESQLDELVAEAAAQTAATDAPDPSEHQEGDALEHAHAALPEHAAASTAADELAESPEPESIDQLDDLLSNRAGEALVGDFETVDEVLRSPAREAGPTTSATNAPAGDDDDADPDANFQTLDEALDEMTGVDASPSPVPPPPPPPASASAPDAQEDVDPDSLDAASLLADEKSAASAADVAAALDAEESGVASSHVTPTVADSNAADAAKPARQAPAPPGPPPPPGKLTRTLAMAWAPSWMRDLTGFLGIQTLLLAACLFTYVVAGRQAALIAAAAAFPMLTLLFYLTFIRRSAA